MASAYAPQLLSYDPNLLDVAPGGLGTDDITNPLYGTAYTLRRPSLTPPPVATLSLSVDGGPATPVPLAGVSPSYAWTAAIDPAPLADGPHSAT
jgi:hypothetical protein